MNYFKPISLLLAMFASSCTQSDPEHEQFLIRVQEHNNRMADLQREREAMARRESMSKALEPYTAKQQTDKEKQEAIRLRDEYTVSLVNSIRELDDFQSPANVIARAAVAANMKKLRDWKRANLAHFSRSSDWFATEVDARLSRLPSNEDIDSATALVLKHRSLRRAGN